MGVAGSDGTGLWGYSPNHNAVFASTQTGYCLNTRALGNNSVGVYTNAFGTNSVALIANGPSILNGSLAMNGQLSTSFPVVLTEANTPPAPTANRLVLFARDNGSGATQLCVRFATGDVQVLATEP
jgi:hypothetical protein